VLDLAVFYFNDDRHYELIRPLRSKPSVPDRTVSSAMLDKVCTIVENARKDLSLWDTPNWPSLTRIEENIFYYSHTLGASQHADFKNFLTNKQPRGWDLDTTWPKSWKLEELNAYYRKVVQKVPYVLALIGECYTHKNDTSQLNERIKSIYDAFQDKLNQDSTKMLRQFAGRMQYETTKGKIPISKLISKKALFETFKDVKEGVDSHFTELKELLKNNLMSIKEMVPTSADFIEDIKEKIASIDPAKKGRALRLDNNSFDSFDNMLKVDKDTVVNEWFDEKSFNSGTIVALIEYMKSNETLNFSIEKRGIFRHKEDGTWELRVMQQDKTGLLVPKLYKFTPEEQGFIVRDLLERNVLTPLRNVGLITDHIEEEKKVRRRIGRKYHLCCKK